VRQADELPSRRLGDRAAERGLAHAGRADQAQDRALEVARALLHGQVLQDPLLDLLQAVVVLVQDALGLLEVDRLGLGLAPRDGQQPVEVVPHDRGLGRHRAHVLELLQLALGLGPRLLRQLGLTDALLEFDDLVAGVVGLAELALDRLHLLVQIVLALSLLHLALDARADLLLDLQHRDLALHQGVDPLQPARHAEQLQQRLLVGDLHRQVRRDGVGQLARVGDVRDRAQRLGRHLLVQLDVVLELLDHRARQGFGLVALLFLLGDVGDLGLVELGLAGELVDGGAALALDQHLHGAVRELEQLQHGGDDADLVDARRRRIVVRRVLLRRQHDLLVAAHDLVERADRFVPPDEERHHHVRENHDIPQGQHR
jgi:hypothetical protein